MDTKKVAIIGQKQPWKTIPNEISGAGPSGLVTAKTLLHQYPKGSFEPIIFDSKPVVGGIWAVTKPDGSTTNFNQPSDFVDCYMRTNLSRFSVSFSDHSWNLHANNGDVNAGRGEEEDMFPQAWKVGEYLKSYSDRFLPKETLRLSCRVIRTRREQNVTTKKWTVEWTDQSHSEHRSESFDYLVVASGYFSRPYIPTINGLDQFPHDRIMHTSSLRSTCQILSNLEEDDGKILVVGGSMSGAEAAASLALDLSSLPSQKSVHHITTRPFWAIPTYLPSNNQPGSFLPLDIVMYDLSRRPPGDIQHTLGPVTRERANMVHAYFESLIGSDQSDIAKGLAVGAKSDRDSAPWVAVTDHYAGFVRAGAIRPRIGRMCATHWTEGGAKGVVEIEQNDGKILTLDNVAAIIFATGFTPFESLSFLPEDVLQTLEYTENETVFPILLDEKSVRNPNIPDLGFVGMYRGPYWGVMEMQARSLARQWSGTPEPITADTTKVKTLRTALSLRAQFPMGDYVGLMETFAREMQIPRESLQTDNAEDRNGPVIPARYFVSTNTDESISTSSSEMIDSLRNLLLSQASPHKERQRGLSKTILRGLHGYWRYERSTSSETMPITGQASIHLRKVSFSQDTGFTTEFVYEEDSGMTQSLHGVAFRILEDGYIHTTRHDTTGRLEFISVESIDGDAPYQCRHFAREVGKTSQIDRTFIFNLRGVNITSWEAILKDKQTNTATITTYMRAK
ncbi:conserved hypothetical protein [Talaromyces stipitatus ATCC 10500]|uniref:FAD/NAD(P)-binding domain-containing protein n=1 Tax=Talaromyces stipitatus (strain ATCC 10500 / CBS 375.48 / QM 6759 / NRRL 1006) TaxID=441959 RepID=B8LVU5_TALSN|nr:uncharacterized protein TSTA_076760 [Talaromyces stipitatus ATCC 10500]EED24311.1 conserved hypothetical protein [Talaromyces stipitatus ATCC 10500]